MNINMIVLRSTIVCLCTLTCVDVILVFLLTDIYFHVMSGRFHVNVCFTTWTIHLQHSQHFTTNTWAYEVSSVFIENQVCVQ